MSEPKCVTHFTGCACDEKRVQELEARAAELEKQLKDYKTRCQVWADHSVARDKYIFRVEKQFEQSRARVAESEGALERFRTLDEAVDPSYPDEVIIRCEVTAGDIRKMTQALARAPGDALTRLQALEKVAEAARMGLRELNFMLSAFPERRGGMYEKARDSLETSLKALDAKGGAQS